MFIFEQLQVVSGECLLYAFWPSLFFSSVVGVLLICIQFIGPLVILIYCYGRIIWVLTRRMDVNIGNNEANQTVDTFQTARSNTIKTFLLIAICFIICGRTIRSTISCTHLGLMQIGMGSITNLQFSCSS